MLSISAACSAVSNSRSILLAPFGEGTGCRLSGRPMLRHRFTSAQPVLRCHPDGVRVVPCRSLSWSRRRWLWAAAGSSGSKDCAFRLLSEVSFKICGQLVLINRDWGWPVPFPHRVGGGPEPFPLALTV